MSQPFRIALRVKPAATLSAVAAAVVLVSGTTNRDKLGDIGAPNADIRLAELLSTDDGGP